MDFLNDIITFFLGENALADGIVGFEDVLNALYFKDTPLLRSIYDVIYEGFWDFLLKILNIFV